MKKILLFASALAGLFLAGSCQRDNLEPEQTGKQVTFTVEAPAAMQTKAIADGLNVDELIYEVWITGQSQKVKDLSGATRLYQAKTDKKTVADGKVSFKITLDLVNDQNFTVLFWAQKAGNGVYDTGNLNAVTYLANADLSANNPNRDAFYSSAYVIDGATETPTVTLRRPFAQVNLCTLNLKDTQKEGDYTITLDKSKMTFTTVPNKFNIATGDASGEMRLEFVYNVVPGTGENADPNDKTIKVNDQPYYYAGMNFVFADKNEGNTAKLVYDIQTKLNKTVEANVNNTIDQIPLKQNHRTNIVGNLLTSKTDYEIVVDAAFFEPSQEVLVSEVTNSDDLQVALQQDLEHIIIDLSTNSAQTKALASPVEYTVPVNQNTFGGASTKTITINANGNILNFVYSNGDSQSIKCANPEAKIIINDATLTNSGKNDGPWNRHDIVFRHAVELNNVTSDKAIALLGNAKLTDVAISDVHPTNAEAYGLWITPLGQTVELDGVTITPSANKKTDRAITINEQYYEAESAPVVLTVKNSRFVSQKKAAVLVKSNVETTINWSENNNITNVAADPIHAVWVDKAYADSYDLVTVNGALKALEGSAVVPTAVVGNAVELQAAVNAAAAGNNLIAFRNDIDGVITIRQKVGVNIVINGDDKNFDGTFILEGGEQGNSPETLKFQNINFVHEDGSIYFIDANSTVVAERYAHNVTVDNCTFTGSEDAVAMRYRQTYNMTVSNSSVTGIHSLLQAYGANGVTIDEVSVGAGRGVSLGSSTNVTIKDSEFTVESYGVRGNGDGDSYDINIAVENSTIVAKQPIVIRQVTDADHTYNVTLTGATLTALSEDGYHVVFTSGDDAAEYVKPTGTYTLTGAENFLVYPRDYYYPVATWADFTAGLAANEAKIRLTADITYDANYQLQKAVIIDLNEKSMTLPMINIHTKTTIKNGTINGKVYARKNSDIVFDKVKFSGTVSDNLSTEGHLAIQSGCKLYVKDCLFSPTSVSGSQTKPVSFEGGSSTMKFENCEFKSSPYKKQVYFNSLSATATLDFTNCNFNKKTPNIMFAAACPLTNLTMSGTTKLDSVTLETNRAKTAVTEVDLAYLREMIANNSFSSVRLFYAGDPSEYIR